MDNLIQNLATLIGFETTSAKSNLAMIDFIASSLKDKGFRTQKIKSSDPDKVGLYAEIGPQGEGILLSAHTDTVPTEGQTWTSSPFSLRRDGERLYGRGTTDMKAYIACMLEAASLAAKSSLKQPLKLVLSYDEEIGCVGIKEMRPSLTKIIGKPRLCIVGEPTMMQLALGHKGKRALTAKCIGESGHSALAPRFVNALHLASDFISEIRKLQDWYAKNGAQDEAYDIPYTSFHVGKLNGGVALNMIPEEAELLLEYRHLPQDDPDTITGQIKDIGKTIASTYGAPAADIQIETYNDYPGLEASVKDKGVKLATTLAETEKTIKVGFGTEAGYFAAMGIPTVVCGPGSMAEQGHKPDEYITTAQLGACSKMMERIVAKLTLGTY